MKSIGTQSLMKTYLAVVQGQRMLFARVLKRNNKVNFDIGTEEAYPYPIIEPPIDATFDTVTEEVETYPLVDALKAALAKSGCTNLVPIIPSYHSVYNIFTIPEAAQDDLHESVALHVEELSPFDEDESATGFEVLGIYAGQIVIFGAAVPLLHLTDWYQAIVANNRPHVGRIGSTLLCWYRGILAAYPATQEGRCVLIVHTDAETVVLVVDQGTLIGARGLETGYTQQDFNRELLIGMTNAELTFGPKDLKMCYCFEVAPDEAFHTAITGLLGCEITSEILEGYTLCTSGLALRITEHPALDLTPKQWRQEEHQRKAKRLMTIISIIVGIIWLACAGALWGIPAYYEMRTNSMNQAIKDHQRAYRDVLGLRDRIDLIERYTKRDYSSLEILRLVCQAKASEIIFSSFNFRQKQNVRISGTAAMAEEVYSFKDALEKDARIQSVRITRLVRDGRTSRQRFDLEILFLLPDGELTHE